MKIPASLENNYDNYFYKVANDWEAKAIACNEKEEYFKSWGWSTAARLPYLIDVVIDAVVGTFALIGMLFGLAPVVFTWGKEAEVLNFFSKKTLEKANHLLVSAFGALVSPWVSHLGKDFNVIGWTLSVLGSSAHEFDRRTYFSIRLAQQFP